jgi:predicted RecA/RadA family phage recombinase
MATNYIQPGNCIDYTAGSDISSGDVVVVGGLLGVAMSDIANGDTGAVGVSGVYSLPKVTAHVLSVGERVQYDVSASSIADDGATPASGDLVNCGIVTKAAGNGDTTVEVLINVAGATIT